MVIERLTIIEGVPILAPAAFDVTVERALREHRDDIQLIEPGEHLVGENEKIVTHLSVFENGTGRYVAFSKKTGALILSSFLPQDARRTLTLLHPYGSNGPEYLHDIIRWRPGFALGTPLTAQKMALQGQEYKTAWIGLSKPTT